MAEESHSFSTARARLEDIVAQVRKKDTSLEKSLDLLEEGVRLANACTELIDQQDWTSVSSTASAEDAAASESRTAAETDDASPEGSETVVVEGVAVIDDVIVTDEEGQFVAEVIEVSEYEASPEFADADDAWADESEPVPAEQPDDPAADEG